jgi:hypothetical protein
MPRSSQQRNKHAQEILPTSQKLDVIDSWLQKMLDRFPQKGQISTSEIDDWHHDLGPFSVAAIDFAFESHRRNALFFPMTAQVLDLCISFDPPEQKPTSTCDAICKARHWKGYGWKDMYWMYERMQESYRVGDIPDSEALLTELDSKRHGRAPEWRRNAASCD